MILKKQLILLVILSYTSVYSQMPIHKVETDCRKNIIYKLEDKRSDVKLVDSSNIVRKLNNEKSINDFIVNNKKEINVYITSLNVLKTKNGNLRFNKLKKSKYQPDIILNEFIIKNLSFESFSNLNKREKYKIGVFMYYNFQDSLNGIEFVELKEDKYYLIYRIIQKNH